METEREREMRIYCLYSVHRDAVEMWMGKNKKKQEVPKRNCKSGGLSALFVNSNERIYSC